MKSKPTSKKLKPEYLKNAKNEEDAERKRLLRKERNARYYESQKKFQSKESKKDLKISDTRENFVRENKKQNTIKTSSFRNVIKKLESQDGVRLLQVSDSPVEAMFSVKCEKLVKLIESGVVSGYENNRYLGSINENAAKNIKDNLDLSNFNTITLMAREGDAGRFVIIDGNSRCRGILDRKSAGNLTKQEMNSTIFFRVSGEGNLTKIYSGLNSGKAHTRTMKTSNPDFEVTKELNKIKSAVGYEYLPSKFNLMLLDMLCYKTNSDKSSKLAKSSKDPVLFAMLKNIFKYEHIQNKIVDGYVNFKDCVSPDAISEVTKCLRMYSDIMREIVVQSRKIGAAGRMCRTVLKSNGIFFVLMSDFMVCGPIYQAIRAVNGDLSKLASKILESRQEILIKSQNLIKCHQEDEAKLLSKELTDLLAVYRKKIDQNIKDATKNAKADGTWNNCINDISKTKRKNLRIPGRFSETTGKGF
jgi:hypothetical protein